jgi:hypothetical protein
MPAGSCRLQIDIGSGESGLVAVGFDRGAMAAWDGEGEGTSPQDLVVWESPDGSSWTRTLIGRDQGPPLDAYFAQVVEIPSGWLILAQSMYWDQGAAYRVSLFSSPDGRIWERLDTGDTFERAIVTGVTAGPEGLVAVGGAEGCLPPAAWYSTDGLEWARTDLAKEDCDWAAMKVVHTDVGYLAGIAEGTVWWSPDGRTWTAVEVPVLRDVALHDLSTDGHTIVATGSQDEPSGPHGVWVWPPRD